WHGKPHLHENVPFVLTQVGVAAGQIPLSPHEQVSSVNVHVAKSQAGGVTGPGWPRLKQLGAGWPAGWPKSLSSQSSPDCLMRSPHHPPIAQPEELILQSFVHASMPPW